MPTEQHLRNRPLWLRIVYLIIGLIFIIMGLIGSVLPVVPGFVFVIIGLPLLTRADPRIGQWLDLQMRKTGQAFLKIFRKTDKSP